MNAKLKYFFIAFLLVISVTKINAQKAPELKAGDLLFQKITCGPLCDAILAVTSGYQGQQFNHIGMLVQQGDSLMIIEAIGKDVHLSTVADFMKRSAHAVFIGRPKAGIRQLIPEAIAFAKEALGTPYDDAFLYQNGKYYCSELIYDAFLAANRGKPVFDLMPMTYKRPGSNEIFPVWQTYFDALKQAVPEGLPGCNPGGISLSSQIEMLGIYGR